MSLAHYSYSCSETRPFCSDSIFEILSGEHSKQNGSLSKTRLQLPQEHITESHVGAHLFQLRCEVGLHLLLAFQLQHLVIREVLQGGTQNDSLYTAPYSAVMLGTIQQWLRTIVGDLGYMSEGIPQTLLKGSLTSMQQ